MKKFKHAIGAMLAELWRHLPKKPATVLYPFERLEIPQDFRGKIVHDAEKCNGCGLCARDCPATACNMIQINEKKKKPIFMLDRCIFCGVCSEVCPKDAITLTKGFELAHYDRKELVVE
jgi:formate hydrogenlyase subunit 6/NADH:ubiquinone oxidoreductase subunit I